MKCVDGDTLSWVVNGAEVAVVCTDGAFAWSASQEYTGTLLSYNICTYVCMCTYTYTYMYYAI